MIKKTYSEKLKDPRWQQKRLKILERDKWECQRCGDDKETLHVHHKVYSGEPWEANDEDLLTICEQCHGLEESYKKEVKDNFLKWLSNSPFTFEDITYFMPDLKRSKLKHPAWKILQAIKFALIDEDAQNILVSAYTIKKESADLAVTIYKKENNIVDPEDLF